MSFTSNAMIVPDSCGLGINESDQSYVPQDESQGFGFSSGRRSGH